MYDWPELREATDAFWTGLVDELGRRGVEAPGKLIRGTAVQDHWSSPDLLLSQSCGYPFVRRLRGRVRLVMTPVYAAEGHRDHRYHSAIMVRRDDPAQTIADLAGRPVAVNYIGSHSGWIALRAAVALSESAEGIGSPYFKDGILTGSHRASLRAVADGHADYCAIDSVCLELARRHEPEAMGALRVLVRTPSVPGLPLITAGHRSDEELATLRESLRATLFRTDLADARTALLLSDFAVLDDGAYDRIVELEELGETAGPPPRFDPD